MKTVSDCPSAIDIAHLEQLLSAPRLDRAELVELLDHIQYALEEHAEDLDESGGLLTRHEEAARPSLAREAERLRQEVWTLADQAGDLSQQVEQAAGIRAIRQQAQELLDALRRQRNEEADVKLESIDTDIGAGD